MPYRTLDASKIIKTLRRLSARVDERFPDRGLSEVCRELVVVAEHNGVRAARIARPYLLVRLGVFAIVAAAAALVVLAVTNNVWRPPEVAALLDAGSNGGGVSALEGIEAAVNLLLLTAGGIFFLTTAEERMKRRRILDDLHELRSLAHVVDMHQLTKDPMSILNKGLRTKSSPQREMSEFQLTRYLDYCAEMLSLIGKQAALYAQNVRDPVVIHSVNELEELTTNLARKIWQKIMIIQRQNELRQPAPVVEETASRPGAEHVTLAVELADAGGD